MNELDDLLGQSAAIESLRVNIRRLVGPGSGSHRLPAVLIQGETGTGKGLVARLLHRVGPRREYGFIEVNCAAIPDTLLESELFGFEKGAFTDARRSKPGLFQAAHRGTIFLDEISLLPDILQAKLLKVVEEHSVRRLGAIQNEPVDVWVISASNIDLPTAIRARRFREDLYHRLAVLTLSLPPLRARGADILLLAEHFLAQACTDYGLPARVLAPDARARLIAYSWPGNVRELANTMERAVLIADTPQVTAAVLDLKDVSLRPLSEPDHSTRAGTLDNTVSEQLQAVLDQTGGNISRTAAALGIARNTLRARIRKLGLRVPGTGHGRRGDRATGAARGPAHDTLRSSGQLTEAVAPPVPFRWERRMIATLATSLSARPDTSVFQLAPTLHELIQKLKSFGARIEELTPVGLVAMFGLEPMENATGRAAHTALGILRAVERAEDSQRNGIRATLAIHSRRCLVAQGSDVTGMDAADRRETYAALDRLIQSATPNTIVVDRAAAQFLQRRFELEPAGAIGRPPGSMYRLTGPGHTGFEVGGRGLSPFVGREHDLAMLRDLLARAEGGRGQVVTIVGEAGVGKSRLLHEFRQALAPGYVTYLEGRCSSYGSTIPYLPFIDIVRSNFALVEADTSEATGEKVRAGLEALGIDPKEWAPYLLHFLGCADGTEALVSLSPDAVKTRTMEALRRMALSGSQRRPIVFVMEDLQWIDRTSEDTLSSLAEDLASCPILLIATYRPGYQAPWPDRSYVSQLPLQGLTRSDSLAVVHSVAPKQQLPSDLEQTILSRAEGIPFFLEELARAISEHPDLRSEVMLPETVQDVLVARLDRLPTEYRDLLQTASVIGKDVSVPILTAVTNLPGPVLAERLERLRAAEFLHEQNVFPTQEYTFKHALTHEVSYWSMLEGQRTALHARVVDAIEAVYSDRLPEHVDSLAYHAFRGKVWDKAVTYLRSAGDRALRSSANGEAAEFFEQALSALGNLPATTSTLTQAVDVRLNLRDALWALAKLPQIHDHLRAAESLAQGLGDRRREGWIACYLSQHAWSVVHLDSALEAGDRALAIARSLPDRALEVETSFYLGLVHLALGDAERAASLLSTNLRILDQVAKAEGGQFPSRRFALNGPILVRGWMSRVLAELGNFADAEKWGREAIRLGEEADSPFALTTALACLGASYLRKGEPEQAIPPLERVLELCRTYKFNNWFPTVAACLGAAYVSGGRIESGVTLLEEAVNQGAERGIVSSSSLWLVYLGEAYLHAHRGPESLAVAHRALQLCREHKERGYEAWALRLLGDIAAQADSPNRSEAEPMYRDALALAERLGMRPLAARCRLGLGRLAERVGDRSDAEAHLSRASALCRELEMPLMKDSASA
jgi:transcriptional regulator with AAA-type ATPase domain/tetratricopeptide (TPR) repeat protein